MIVRLVPLYVGLILYGLSSALLVRGDLGLDPWDVFHQGLANHTGLSFGAVIIVVGALVLVLWIPLRQKPGLGTLSNVVLVGLAANAGLASIPPAESLAIRVAMMLGGVVLCGVATGMYIGAGFGPGPRDGLMTGIVQRTRLSVRLVRTTIELTVLAIGWVLGGGIGVGTVVYALSIGPLVQAILPFFERLTAQQASYHQVDTVRFDDG